MKNQNNISKTWFEFYENFISDAKEAKIGRARQDIPTELIINNLTPDEKAIAKDLLLRKIKTDNDIILISAITLLDDERSIPLIEEKLKLYKEKNQWPNTNFSYCITTCKMALKKLRKQKRI